MTFEEYVTARGTALFRLAMVLTGQQAAAEDLLQSTLVDALSKWSRVDAADDPDSYMRRVMINRHLSWGRRKASSEVLGFDGAATVAEQPDIAIEIAERDLIRVTLAALGLRSRTILALRYYADLSDNEIAELLGVEPGTVRSLASRALATLRSRMDSDLGEGASK